MYKPNKEKLMARAKIIRLIRDFFDREGFIETDTPQMARLPGMEPHLEPFQTDGKFLITSPEYAMKRLLAAGFEKIFQIAHCFRKNETGGRLHNPEFAMCEWYRANGDYTDMMADTENLIAFLAEKLFGQKKLIFQGRTIDVTPPFERMTVQKVFETYANIDQQTFENETALIAEAKRRFNPKQEISYDDAFFLIFLNEIEPKLGFEKPVFVYDYPISMAALAKKSTQNPRYAERVELYIAGIELCNAFSELTDAEEQRKRFEREYELRKKLGRSLYPIDDIFLDALQFMPESGGNALGVDRLIMLLTDTPDISEIIFFPWNHL